MRRSLAECKITSFPIEFEGKNGRQELFMLQVIILLQDAEFKVSSAVRIVLTKSIKKRAWDVDSWDLSKGGMDGNKQMTRGENHDLFDE
jgi:hypothetical protein